jgi:hypothetical protein
MISVGRHVAVECEPRTLGRHLVGKLAQRLGYQMKDWLASPSEERNEQKITFLYQDNFYTLI